MSSSKKCKVVSECRIFQKKWKDEYFHFHEWERFVFNLQWKYCCFERI